MVEKYVTFIIFISLYTQVISQCIQSTPCSCTLPDGTGYDFSSLANQGPLNFTLSNVTFWFQPCKDVVLSNKSNDDGCDKPVSLCTWNVSDPVSKEKGPVSLGSLAESKLELEPDHEHILMLVYKHKNNTTKINLICCPEGCTTALRYDSPSADPSVTNLLLLSPAVCKHQRQGISSGSVFFILLLVFAGVYFIGGALALKFLRGATGWEMLPNHAFWCALGRQIKAGFIFLCSGCKEDSYERI